MSSFTWQDVLNHLQSCSADELNREVQVYDSCGIALGDYTTLGGITTHQELVNGVHQSVPVLVY